MPDNNILMFGGTFDPIHIGHLIIARAAADQLRADKIIFIPAAQPPHKLHVSVTPYHHRLAMTKLAVQSDPDRCVVSDCEASRPGPSYTLDTVRQLKKLFPANNYYWLIGGDTVRELPTWYKIDQLADECTIATALRPGSEQPDLNALSLTLSPQQISTLKSHILNSPLIDISATDIRRRAAKNIPFADLVPPAVETYINAHQLYR